MNQSSQKHAVFFFCFVKNYSLILSSKIKIFGAQSFITFDMCCACGGGVTRDVDVPVVEPICQDTDMRTTSEEKITDSYGDTCDWYDSKINNTFCGEFDTDEF